MEKEVVIQKPLNYLPDTVTNISDDFGVHTHIADSLEQKILEADVSQNALTIGLFGEWGTGKSVIIEKLSEKIKPRSDISFINIDIWKYNGIPLLRHVLYEIAKQGPNGKFNAIDKEKIQSDLDYNIKVGTSVEKYSNPTYKALEKWLPKIKLISLIAALVGIVWNSIPNFSNWLSTLIAQITVPSALIAFVGDFVNKGIIKSFKSWFADVSQNIVVMDKTIVPTISPEQFEREFDNLLKELSERGITKHVIIFDNIDRCKGDFAYNVLSTIKTYMSKENCIYIIPCDDVAIKHYLANEYKHIDEDRLYHRDFASEFLDKLFTTYFRVPLTNILARDKFIDKCLSQTAFKENTQKSKLVAVLYYAYKGETPRQVKKYINDLISYYEIALKVDPNEEFLLNDIETFAVMVAIKQIAPDFEKKLLDNTNLIWTIKELEDSNLTTQDIKIKELFKNLRFIFPKTQSVQAYIYFERTDVEAELFSRTRDGNEFDFTNQNAILVYNLLENDKNNEKFLQNDFNSIIDSVIKYGVEKFIAEKEQNKNFQELFHKLNETVNNSVNYNIVLYCLENLGNDSKKISKVFILFNYFMTDTLAKSVLFENFEDIRNKETIYNLILASDLIDFSNCIENYINRFASGKDVVLTEHLYLLLIAISNNRKYNYYTNAFIEKISPLITYSDTDWIKWEKDAIINLRLHLLYTKILILTQTCSAIIQDQGLSLSSNTDNVFEEMEYLFSFSELSVEILSQISKYDSQKTIHSCFSTHLIRLSNLSDEAENAFILGSKMFGKDFIEQYFVQRNIAYENRNDFVKKVCNDEDLLDLFTTANKVFEKLIEEDAICNVILAQTSENWKIKNISKFVYSPINTNLVQKFVTSEVWDTESKNIVNKTLAEQCTHTVNAFSESSSITEASILSVVDFSLTELKNCFSFLDVGESVFVKAINANFATGVKIYNLFKNHNYHPDFYFKCTLNHISDVFPKTTNDVPNVTEICSDIRNTNRIIDNSILMKLIEKCILVANKPSVIRIGLSALSRISDGDVNIISTYQDRLNTIKSGKVLVAEIDELLSKFLAIGEDNTEAK